MARLVFEKLKRRADPGLDVVGCVAEQNQGPLDGLPTLGRPRDVPLLVAQLGVERVIIAAIDEANGPSLIRSLRDMDVQIDFVPRPLEAVGLGGSVYTLDGVPMIGLSPLSLSSSSLALKRGMDLLLSGLGWSSLRRSSH